MALSAVTASLAERLSPSLVTTKEVGTPPVEIGRQPVKISTAATRKSISRFEVAIRRAQNATTLQSAVCDVLEGFVTLLEPKTQPLRRDPNFQLAGNFAPVTEECPPTGHLNVTGTIPTCLNGVFLRNGGNPLHHPTGGFHMFDGDGMLHAVRIRDGVPSYCCRFTRTYRYLQEKEAGQPLFPLALGEMVGLSGVARLSLFSLRRFLGILDWDAGYGTANAGLAFYNGRLLAMSEEDKPYAVNVTGEGDLITLGRYDFDGKLSHNMTAHPKIDPATGELFGYSYDVIAPPYLKYFHASNAGRLSPDVPISLAEPVMMHDFGVTKKYAVFPDSHMVFRLSDMIAGNSPITIDANKATEIGILPKDAVDDSQMRWFKSPVSCYHYLNAWDDGDEVVLLGCWGPPEKFLDDPHTLYTRLTEFRLNVKTGLSSQRVVCDENLEMGTINQKFYGRKNRFVYLSISGPWPKTGGLAKIDLHASSSEESIVGWHKYPPGCYGSEPVFASKFHDQDSESIPAEDEDNGFILTYLHNENTNVSELIILDARSSTLETVASVALPVRVPYGFHSIFLSEAQLARQNPLPLNS